MNLFSARFGRRFAMLGLSMALAVGAHAQSYPAKPIRLVVPWPAGGVVDLAARQIGTRLQTALGQPGVVENKLGAGGNIGADMVAKAPADGYTLLLTSSALTVSTAVGAKMQFDAVKDLDRVALVGYAPSVLVVSASSKIQTVQELIKAARAQPGALSYASAGVGSPAHMTGELFKSRKDLFILHIPYTGAPAAMTDQIAGRIDFHFSNAAVALPQVKAGKVRALAVTSAQRSAALADVPTIEEAAGLKGFEATSWFGLLAPAATAPETVSRIQQEVARALGTPAIKEKMLAQGAIPSGNTPAEFAKLIETEHVKWAQVVKASGARVD